MRKTLFIILFSVFIFKAYSQNEFPLLNYQLVRYNTRITYIDLFFSYNNELETLEIYLSYMSNDFWDIRSMIEGS
jgi:hypothetical protein